MAVTGQDGDSGTSTGYGDDGFVGVLPPRRPRPGVGQVLGGVLFGLVVAAALVGALLLGRPALDVDQQQVPHAPEAAEGR